MPARCAVFLRNDESGHFERIDFRECPLPIYGPRWRWPSLRPEGHTEEREGENRQGQTGRAKAIVTGARPSWEFSINSAVNGPAERLNH